LNYVGDAICSAPIVISQTNLTLLHIPNDLLPNYWVYKTSYFVIQTCLLTMLY